MVLRGQYPSWSLNGIYGLDGWTERKMAEQSGWKSRLEDRMISVRWWDRPADMCGQGQHVGRAELPVQLRIELYLDNPFF
jgi:hypothetical protein